MTDKDTDSDSDKSRRSFMRDGAIASGGLALGLSAAGTAAAQEDGGFTEEGDDGDDVIGGQQWKGLIQTGAFQPAARFAFVSGVIDWNPSYGDIQDSWFSDYNTYQIRWQNTGEVVPFWVAQDAGIGEFDSDLGFIGDADDDSNQPQLFEMSQEAEPFGDNPQLTTVNFSPVEEEAEDRILQDEDWWQNGDQGVVEDGATDETAGNESDEGLLGNTTETETAVNGNESDDGVL